MNLKTRFGYGTFWMSMGASATSAVSFIVFVVLSRVLSPEEIGLVAFALIFVEGGKVITSSSITKAIVQHQRWDDHFASTCFYLNAAFSISGALLLIFIGAPLLAHYYDPESAPLLQALSCIFVLEGVKAVHEGKLSRDFAFRTIALRTMISSLVSGAVGIYLALNGFGVWALVWQQIINHVLIATVTISVAGWAPSLKFSSASCRQVLKFSSPLMGAQLIGAISARVFELFVGIFIGPVGLGLFKVAGRALYILQDIVLKPFERTVLAALSRVEGKGAQAAATLRLTRMSAYFIFPLFFGAAAVAPEFILFAFGSKWALSGEIMSILALGIAPHTLEVNIKSAMTASGKSNWVMLLAGVVLITNIAAGVISVPMGLMIAAWGFAIRSYVTISFSLYAFKSAYGVAPWRVIKIVAPAFLASLIMLGLLEALSFSIPADTAPGIALLILCASGALIYGALMISIFRAETNNFFRESFDLLPAKWLPLVNTVRRIARIS